MRSLFMCDFDSAAGRPVLPSDDEIIGGVDGQGWVTASYTPATTCLVLVNSSEAVIDAMKADPAYTWLEDIDP